MPFGRVQETHGKAFHKLKEGGQFQVHMELFVTDVPGGTIYLPQETVLALYLFAHIPVCVHTAKEISNQPRKLKTILYSKN